MKSFQPRTQAGNAILEFTLVGIPMIFLLISVVELSRGMWIYNALQHAIKETARTAIVHGQVCVQASAACALTVGQVATLIEQAGVGLDPSKMSVVLTSTAGSQSCTPLKSCEGIGSAWPPSPANSVGLPVTIYGSYPFVSALAMFWPGAGAMQVAAMNFSAESREEIQF